MLFRTRCLGFLAVLGSVYCQDTWGTTHNSNFDTILRPAYNETVLGGVPYKIQWTIPSGVPDGLISIELLRGSTQDHLDHIANPPEDGFYVAKSIPNSDLEFTWDPDPYSSGWQWFGLNFTLDSDHSFYQVSAAFQWGDNPNATATYSTTTALPTAYSTASNPSPTSASAAPTSTNAAGKIAGSAFIGLGAVALAIVGRNI
ncbi:hypothetical protein GQ53DRAFT_832902 [Thozetella sp. PMI_491]|nr:hypothetical protein GQ53DRAFT_832902 [Thozetella sp. PMI_491]